MLELNKVYCMDCIEGLKQLDENSIDLIVTSPPYNVGIKYDVYNDKINFSDYYKWCEYWLKECLRVLKPDGRFCLNHYLSLGQSNNRSAPLMNLNSMAENIGFKHHGLSVWWDTHITKRTAWGSFCMSSAPYISLPLEGVLILYKDSWKKLTSGKSTITKKEFIESCSGIWKLQPEFNRTHPAPFPVSLPRRCINMFSYEGDLVLDPFMGSGTTGVAAKLTNRNWIGFDLSKDYQIMAENRISDTTIQLNLFEEFKDKESSGDILANADEDVQAELLNESLFEVFK